MTFLNSFFYHEQGWWPTPRWALRVLSIYAIAALSGALLFLICTVLLAIFFPRQTPTAPNLALSVFGYIDLVKLGTGGALVCIVPYLIYMIIATKKARHQLIFASTVVLIAIFSGLMLTERLTAETIKFPQGMELRTNKVDARL